MSPEVGPEDVLFSVVVLRDGTVITSGRDGSPDHLPEALRHLADALDQGHLTMDLIMPPGSLN